MGCYKDAPPALFMYFTFWTSLYIIMMKIKAFSTSLIWSHLTWLHVPGYTLKLLLDGCTYMMCDATYVCMSVLSFICDLNKNLTGASCKYSMF